MCVSSPPSCGVSYVGDCFSGFGWSKAAINIYLRKSFFPVFLNTQSSVIQIRLLNEADAILFFFGKI